MQITRRDFVRSIGVGACTLYLAGAGTVLGQTRAKRDRYFQVPAEAYSDPLYSMTAKQFEPFLSKEFLIVSSDGESFVPVLTEVNPHENLENALDGVYGESFSLIFEFRSDEVKIHQGVYLLSSPGIEEFSALVV